MRHSKVARPCPGWVKNGNALLKQTSSASPSKTDTWHFMAEIFSGIPNEGVVEGEPPVPGLPAGFDAAAQFGHKLLQAPPSAVNLLDTGQDLLLRRRTRQKVCERAAVLG